MQKTGVKILLAGVGILGGLILAAPLLYFFILRDDGKHYQSLDSLRQAINSAPKEEVKGGSVSLRSIIRAVDSDEVIYDLKPNLDVTFQGVPVRTNSFGMRGPETTLAKPPNTFRIALIGDSFAFGWGVREEESFAHLLEVDLQKYAPTDTKIEVLNFAVPGYSTFQEVAKFLDSGVKFSPDAVLVYFVENDFGLPFFLSASETESTLMNAADFARRVWQSEGEKEKAQRKYLQSIMDPNRGLQLLADKGKATPFKVMLCVNPGRTWAKDIDRLWVLRRESFIFPVMIRERMKQLIAERNIPLDKLQLPTDPHPSAIKHTLLAQSMEEQIGPYLFRKGNQ